MLEYLIASLYTADIPFAFATPTKIMPGRRRRDGLNWIRFDLPEDWHRFQELVLPLSAEKWKRDHNFWRWIYGRSTNQEKCE
jgi:hypothetical protein